MREPKDHVRREKENTKRSPDKIKLKDIKARKKQRYTIWENNEEIERTEEEKRTCKRENEERKGTSILLELSNFTKFNYRSRFQIFL